MANQSDSSAPMMRSIEEGGARRGSSYGTAAGGVFGGGDAGAEGAAAAAGAGVNTKRRSSGFAGLTSSTSLPVVFALGVLVFVVGAAVGVLVGGTHHTATVRGGVRYRVCVSSCIPPRTFRRCSFPLTPTARYAWLGPAPPFHDTGFVSRFDYFVTTRFGFLSQP
jgi:hypothetical protein